VPQAGLRQGALRALPSGFFMNKISLWRLKNKRQELFNV
jgi:hypothetical protein